MIKALKTRVICLRLIIVFVLVGSIGAQNVFAEFNYRNGDWVLSEIQYEWDDDTILDLVATYFYDSNGNMIKREMDYDDDGTVDAVGTFANDSNGNMIRCEWDINNDGNVNHVETYIFDSVGNMIKHKTEFKDSGTVYVESYTYDSNGNMLTKVEGVDKDGIVTDNMVTTCIWINRPSLFHLDNTGEPLDVTADFYWRNGDWAVSEVRYDHFNDGTIELIKTYAYDNNGNMTQIKSDLDNDGTIERIEIYAYDKNGIKIKREVDQGNDGRIDLIKIWE